MLRRSIDLGGIVLVIAVVLCAAEYAMYASTVSGSVSPPEQKGQITGVVVATRTDDGGKRSLLLKTNTTHLGQVVDEIFVKLPNEAAKEAAPGLVPPGWNFTLDGRNLKLSGPPLQNQENIFVRVDVGATKAPRNLEVQLFSEGRKLFKKRLSVSQFPTVRVVNSLKDLMVVPRQVSPGERIEMDVLNPERTPLDGTWTISGVVMEEVEHEGTATEGPPKNPRLFVTLPRSLTPGDRIKVVYTDPWGERIVEAPAVDDVDVVLPPTEIPAAPRITACTPHTFQGGTICVCGWFPNETARNSLTINGEPIGTPVSSSSRVLHVQLQSGMQPGPYVIAGDPSGGFPSEDTAQVVILGVGGEIDRNKLLRGEDTHLRLWVQGTEEILGLRLRNSTPDIVSLEGGEDQVVYTAGGPDNSLETAVHAVSPGDFTITYTLETDPCPCAARQEPRATPALAAAACYMKIADVKGESRDARHQDWIEIESYSPRLNLPSQGTPRTRSTPGQITVVKQTDKSSPNLLRYASTGKHIPTAVLECRKAGGDKQEYLQYKLIDVRVSSVEPRGVMEEVSFTYGKVQWRYLPQEHKHEPTKPKQYKLKQSGL